MATLNLGSFSGLKNGSVIGYSSEATDNYSAAKGLPSDYDKVATVSSITGGWAVDLGSDTTANTVQTGSSSDAWSIVGSSTVTEIETGNKADSVTIGTTSETDVRISVGEGADYVSVQTAAGKLTVQAGDGADSVVVGEAKDNLSVELGNGKDSLTIGAVTGNVIVSGNGSDAKYVSVTSGNEVSIELGEGADSVYLGSASSTLNINTGDGNDSIVVGSIKEEANGTIQVGNGNDFVSVGSATGNLSVEIGEGKDSLELGTVAGELVVTASGTDANYVSLTSASSVNITLGNGADSLKITSVVSGSINLGEGKDSVVLGGLDKATLTAGAGNKYAEIASLNGATVTLGAGNDSVSLGSSVVDSTITLGEGNDSLVLNSLKDSTVYGGAGKDTVIVNDSLTSGLIDLGDGADSITIANLTNSESNVTVAGGEGKDTIDVSGLTAGTVTLTDFNALEDVVVIGGNIDDSVHESGQISVGSGVVQFTKTSDNYYVANVKATGYTGVVAWAAEDGGALINASSITDKSVLLVGNDNNEGVDTLIGGSKNDSLLAGGGDYVYGGLGNDSIEIDHKDAKGTTYVALTSTGGTDSVAGFASVGGSSLDGDAIYLFENSINDLKFESGTKTTAKVGKGSLVLNSVDSSQEVTVKVLDNTGTTYNVDVVGGKATVKDVTEMANIYYGASKSSALDFNTVDDALVVDLGNTGIFKNTSNATYSGTFASVTGGKDNTVLMGTAANKETLIAGTGNTTLWGGGSAADVLDGSNGQSATDTNVTYYYTAGDGKDTIQNAKWGSKDGDDVLYLSGVDITSVKNDGSNIVIKTSNSTDKLTLLGAGSATDTAIKVTTDGVNTTQVKIGKTGTNNWTYSEDVSIYMGGSNNTLKVGSDVDTANIWLDGSQGVSYDSVKTVDASSSSGTLVIAGTSSANESLVAGKGETSLFGGFGASNDSLKGTSGGTTTFFFGKGDGSDVITGSYSDDKVVLYNVTLDDITSGNVGIDTSKSGVMTLSMKDGDATSTLTINSMSSSSVKTFQLADGSTWEYNYSKKTWSQA
ncbi:hypothetical protein [Selenomonas sp. AB3002]|uniref:hypothetical protein n=1 Tax=Selenomonas sp. AB3002 TaxID=1392502 RepID=UPI000495BA6A